MLSTSFCGMNLRNPIVIASCPATESINGIKKCYENGAGAVILKSMADYKYNEFVKIPRRTYIDKKVYGQHLHLVEKYSIEMKG